MKLFDTVEEAEKYGLKNYFEPEITARYNKRTDEFMGYVVSDRWDKQWKK